MMMITEAFINRKIPVAAPQCWECYWKKIITNDISFKYPYQLEHKAVQAVCTLTKMLLFDYSTTTSDLIDILLSCFSQFFVNILLKQFPASAVSKLISFHLQPCSWPMNIWIKTRLYACWTREEMQYGLDSYTLKEWNLHRQSGMMGETTERQHSPAHTHRHPAACSTGPWDRRMLHRQGIEPGPWVSYCTQCRTFCGSTGR